MVSDLKRPVQHSIETRRFCATGAKSITEKEAIKRMLTKALTVETSLAGSESNPVPIERKKSHSEQSRQPYE
jgi:hypothetical protein